jgi:PST family polysaccharide transporter
LSSPSPSNAEIPASETQTSTTYGQILKSSSILGGAQGLNLLIAMARTKVVAMLLGPAGIGMVTLFQSMTTMVGTIAGLGVSSSGVREVADACASDDPQRIAISSRILIRLSWITGLVGWILTAALSYPLSQWTFGSHEHAFAIAILGASLLLTTLSGGQMALIQGMRRIGDIARIQILSMVVGTVVAIALYAWLKEKGIVPVLLTSAAIGLAFSGFYASRIPRAETTLDWKQTFAGSKRLISLGVAFMWSAILTAGVAFATRAIITRDLGIEANGIFQSAWGISGMFAGFILSAMGTDFYPRLTASSHDHALMNRMVNEQTEIGILLALPGLLGTMIFAPLVMKFFYSAKFLAGADLLPWMVLGVFFKIVSWPMGFIQLAKGATRWFVASETIFGCLHLGLTIVLLKTSGLAGAAHAFAALYGIHIFAMLLACGILSQFSWSRQTIQLLLISALVVVTAFLLQKFTDDMMTYLIGALLFIVSATISLRGIAKRLGIGNKWVARLLGIPGAGLVLGVTAK